MRLLVAIVSLSCTAAAVANSPWLDPQKSVETRLQALLPTLSETFERTGDSQLLDAGHRIFRWAVHDDFVTAAHLKDLIAFMPLLENLKLLEEFRAPDNAVDRLREPWPHSVVSGDH